MSESKITFGKIPILKNEAGLSDWRASILEQLEYHNLEHYIKTNVPQPDKNNPELQKKWKQDRILCTNLMRTSIDSTLKKRLVAAGWDQEGERNPKVLWDLMNRLVPKESESTVPAMFYELTSMKLDSGYPLLQFLERMVDLHKRLDQLECSISEKGLTLLALKAIKSRYIMHHDFLMRDSDDKRLSWAQLQKWMTKKGLEESANKSFINTPPSSADDDSKSANKSDTTISSKACGITHPRKWKWHLDCRRKTLSFSGKQS